MQQPTKCPGVRADEESLRYVEHISREWVRTDAEGQTVYTCPAPENARGMYPYGFVRKSDSAADLACWHGFVLEVDAKQDAAAVFQGRLTAVFGRRHELTVPITVPVVAGHAFVEVPLSAFPAPAVQEDRWQFVEAVRVEYDAAQFAIASLSACRGRGVFLAASRRGRSGEAGETLTYTGHLCNCLDRPVQATVSQVIKGWESLVASIWVEGGEMAPVNEALIPVTVQLDAGAHVPFSISVTVHDRMVSAGHEDTVIRVSANDGLRCYEDCLTLKTMRTLPHPYIYHDAQGWQDVRKKIDAYPCYQPVFENWLKTAENWTVKPPMEGRSFCYETFVENDLMCAAYAYVLTGEIRYAEKIAAYFRWFTDPQVGYPARKKGCSQSYVQEGHFFQHMAIPYDIIYDAGVLSAQEKAAVENCFYLYMDMLDLHVRAGHISNWLISELQGALYCAMALQDMDRIDRFVFGNGGLVDQFRYGVFNDGWWYECSVGYNIWVSSMMIHMGHAMRRFGVDLVHARFQTAYNLEVGASMPGVKAPIRHGMYNEKWGGNERNYVTIKQMFDAPLPYLDARGVLFGISDSDEKKLSGVHFGSTYDLAYTYYQDEQYIPVMRRNEADPVFGHPEIDMQKPGGRPVSEDAKEKLLPGAYSDNIGIMMLRSQKEGRLNREQIQAVLRYGSHGYAHGHFDIGQLLSVFRYGKSVYNPENCWWGYLHFMYKFYVQNSLTKNMVVVDDKMQVPADSRRILFQLDDGIQAAGVEVKTRWAYPPYGGMCYHEWGEDESKNGLRHRLHYNRACFPVLEGEGTPRYGELTGHTEEIMQRRVMAVLDDCIILFDYMEGETDHRYDSLVHLRGLKGLEGEKLTYTHHTEQMDENPVSDAQMITDCRWYEAKSGTVAHFATDFDVHVRGDRSSHNEPGVLNMDVHTAWPRETVQMTGRMAVDYWQLCTPLDYQIIGDGRVLAQGGFDGWILGRDEISADVAGCKTLQLVLNQGKGEDELHRPLPTKQICFWGSVMLEMADGSMVDVGERMRAGEHAVQSENRDPGCGIGKDYFGGRVTIVGQEYPHAVPASPADHEQPSVITIDLTRFDAVKLHTCVGVDAFPGDESQFRMTYAVRTEGRVGRFVTVIEPFEGEAQVAGVHAASADEVTVTLRDGRKQTVILSGMAEGRPRVKLI